MALSSSILESLIQNQRDAVKLHTVFSVTIVVIGILIFVISNFYGSNIGSDTLKNVTGIGGGFISTLSAYPINQIILRKEKLRIFETLKSNIDTISTEDASKVEEIIWNSIKNN